jgi:hypothetical protein
MLVLKPPQSGSLAGVTASHNRFGQYERSRRSPVQPTMSDRQSTAKANFAAASAAFSALTQEQIESWNTYADSHPTVNALGQSVKLTGHMMFVSIASQLLNCGQALPTIPPVSSEVWNVAGIDIDALTDGTLTVAWTAGDANDFLLVAVSRPVAPGVTFQKTFRQFGAAGADTATLDVSDAVVAAYGALVLGHKIFVKVTPVNQYGVTGVPVITPVIIAAP